MTNKEFFFISEPAKQAQPPRLVGVRARRDLFFDNQREEAPHLDGVPASRQAVQGKAEQTRVDAIFEQPVKHKFRF